MKRRSLVNTGDISPGWDSLGEYRRRRKGRVKEMSFELVKEKRGWKIRHRRVWNRRSDVNSFNSRGSDVYISSLDASKAFDNVNHSILLEKLMDHNFLFCLIKVLVNWYSKLTAVVRWNGIFSSEFMITCAVYVSEVFYPLYCLTFMLMI